MHPSRKEIERWGQKQDDGWVRIPASCWPDLLWVLSKAEELEAKYEAMREVLDAERTIRYGRLRQS